jgi:adenine phosphoribosyltransferase
MSVDLERYIRAIPDFPVEGILFRDITPLLSAPDAFSHVVSEFAEWARTRAAEVIVGIESRGFIFGAPVAVELGLPFVPVRKPGKLPWEKLSIEYKLEYGIGQLDIHRDALADSHRAVIIDDLLATGGTAEATAKLVEQLGARVAGFEFVVELAGLDGRSRIAPHEVNSLVVYPGA